MDTTKLWETYYGAIKKQDWQKAITALKSLKELKKKDPQVHLKMGDLLQRTSDVAGAVASYHAAGRILMREGFQQKAIAIYKIILRLDPKDSEATGKLSEILIEIESSKQAPQFPSFPTPELEEQPVQTPVEPAMPPETKEAPPSWEAPAEAPKEETVSWESPAEKPEIEAMPPPAEPERLKGGEPVTWESLEELLQELETAPWEVLQEGAPAMPPPKTEEEKQEVPALFSSLTREEALGVLRKAEQRTYENGAVIVEEGDSGDSMFVVKKGRAKVISHILGKTVELATLTEGEFFGEIAFLTGRPRTATVVADGQVQVLEINSLLIDEVIVKNPQVLDKLQDFYQTRVRQTIKKIKGGME